MKQTRLIVRVAAAVLALLLLATTLVSGLGMTGFAADPPRAYYEDVDEIREEDEDGDRAGQILSGRTYYIAFRFILENETGANIDDIMRGDMAITDGNWDFVNGDIDFDDDEGDEGTIAVDTYAIEGWLIAECESSLRYEDITIKIDNKTNDDLDFIIDLTIHEDDLVYPYNQDGNDYDPPDTDAGAEEADPVITSKIVVENMIALDSAGNRIDEITEDTPSFTLEVVFADIGLQYMPARYLRDRDLDAYVTNAGGFILGSSARGTVGLVTNSDYPRFRARFTDVTYSGTGNTLGFTVFYDLDGYDGIDPVGGEGTATLFSAATGEEEETEDGAGIKVPKIIISAYSYGEEAIFAGDEFPLDFTVTNTSADLPLENIVVTMTPAAPEGADKGPGLIVASSSNTIYLPALGPGASQSNSVSFKARPDAEVTSHLVNVRFSYEYQKSEKEGYVAAPELSESIAIPVSQIDRFTVDPIQDAPYAETGQEAYLTVTFINKGKSPTYNISGTVSIDESVNAPPQHFGNLDPGASDSMDFFLTGSVAGSFEGEVILQYEDDNGNVNEVTSPFTMTVEEPWVPDSGEGGMDPGMMEPPPPAGPNVWTIVFCAVGGLSITVPLALYLMKRVRAKGREEFDETV